MVLLGEHSEWLLALFVPLRTRIRKWLTSHHTKDPPIFLWTALCIHQHQPLVMFPPCSKSPTDGPDDVLHPLSTTPNHSTLPPRPGHPLPHLITHRMPHQPNIRKRVVPQPIRMPEILALRSLLPIPSLLLSCTLTFLVVSLVEEVLAFPFFLLCLLLADLLALTALSFMFELLLVFGVTLVGGGRGGLQGFTAVRLLIGFVDLGFEWHGGVLATAMVTVAEGIVDVISERHGGLLWRRLVFDAKMLYLGLC